MPSTGGPNEYSQMTHMRLAKPLRTNACCPHAMQMWQCLCYVKGMSICIDRPSYWDPFCVKLVIALCRLGFCVPHTAPADCRLICLAWLRCVQHLRQTDVICLQGEVLALQEHTGAGRSTLVGVLTAHKQLHVMCP